MFGFAKGRMVGVKCNPELMLTTSPQTRTTPIPPKRYPPGILGTTSTEQRSINKHVTQSPLFKGKTLVEQNLAVTQIW